MPQTTTAINACDARIQLDNSGGTPTDISGSSNNINMEFSNQIGEFRTFGSSWPARIQCGKDAKITLDILYTTAAGEAWAIVKDWFFTTGGTKTLIVDLPSASQGGDRFTFETVLETMPVGGPADEAAPVMVSLSLLPTGAATLSVIP